MLSEAAVSVATPTARPHYVADEGGQLFAWHHPPSPALRRGAAVVLCPTLGGEYICVYHVWRILADGGEPEQIQFLLGHVSLQTTERYLGSTQRIASAVNDRIGIEPKA